MKEALKFIPKEKETRLKLKEMTKITTLQNVIEKRIRQIEAAKILDLTPRRIRQLISQYKIKGVEVFLSQHKGGNRRHLPDLKEQVKTLLHMDLYRGFQPHLCQKN